MSDNRKALGTGQDSVQDPITGDFEKNRLPKFPWEKSLPDIPYTGQPNPAMTDNRPIADPATDFGSGDIDEGVAFRLPMEK